MNTTLTTPTIIMANESAGLYLAPDNVGHFWQEYLTTTSSWQIVAIILTILVAYDQCPSKPSPAYTMI